MKFKQIKYFLKQMKRHYIMEKRVIQFQNKLKQFEKQKDKMSKMYSLNLSSN